MFLGLPRPIRHTSKEFLALPVTVGTYNVSYDAMSQMTRAVQKKNVAGEGMGVWADVLYASNEAKTLCRGQQGRSADIYSGVLGFDATSSPRGGAQAVRKSENPARMRRE